MNFDPYCLNSFLTFRYVTRAGAEWIPGVAPRLPTPSTTSRLSVRDADQTLEALRSLVPDDGSAGILLSSGIDSAILARLLPARTQAYTVRFVAEGAVDESKAAAYYADQARLRHTVVDVHWQDYLRLDSLLMERKSAPLHPIEVPLYLAAQRAKRDGVTRLIVGNGADSTFGGLDKLLARDWSNDEFVRRYTFVSPERILRDSVSTEDVWAPYRRSEKFDVQGFLKEVHGLGIMQAFENAIGGAGLATLEPYEDLIFDAQLDLARIRRGESKYVLRELFRRLYPQAEQPQKIAFARPMDVWLAHAPPPAREQFVADLPWSELGGEQRWLVRCLDQFLSLLERR